MKAEKFKTMLLPIGLLFMAGVSFIEHLAHIELPDFANGFLKGVGIALMISALVWQKVSKACNQ